MKSDIFINQRRLVWKKEDKLELCVRARITVLTVFIITRCTYKSKAKQGEILMLCKCKRLKHVCGHVIKWADSHLFVIDSHRCMRNTPNVECNCLSNVEMCCACHGYFAYKEQIIELLDHRQNGLTKSVSLKTIEHDNDANVFQHIYMQIFAGLSLIMASKFQRL